MSKFDFNVFTSSLAQLVDFFERLESTEGEPKQGNKKGTSSLWKQTSQARKMISPPPRNRREAENGVFHETISHNTKDCHVIKKLKWQNKAEQAKDKAKKELNALKKKMAKLQKPWTKLTSSRQNQNVRRKTTTTWLMYSNER
jgi:hypothetical protein